MIEVKLSFSTIDAVLAFLGTKTSSEPLVIQADTPTVEVLSAEPPTPRKRRTKAEMEAARAETPVLDANNQPVVFERALFSATTAAPESPIKPPSQKELVNAARNLANAKGTDPVVAMLTKYGVKSVVLIPTSEWFTAINAMAKLVGVTFDEIVKTPPDGK